MLIFLGLSDIILQNVTRNHHSSSGQKVSNPNAQKEQSFEVLPDRSHQSNGGVENYQEQLQGQVRTMWQQCENTQYRPSADNALMRWIVRHAAWLIPRFRGGEVQSPFYRAMGGPYRGKLVEFGETVLAHLPEVGKGSGNPAPKLADRWEIWCVAGKERPHGRTPCPNR